jgi:hypothetical protein
LKYTSSDFVIGNKIENFKGDQLLVRSLNTTKGKKSMVLSDNKDRWYSVYFDDGVCIVHSMSERGYDIPYDFPILDSTEVTGDGENST